LGSIKKQSGLAKAIQQTVQVSIRFLFLMCVIGFLTHECLDYGRYPIGVRVKGLKEETIRKISIDGDPREGAIYLYDDGTVPIRNTKNMRGYQERQSVLISLKVQ
jgi:hypothetical protein